MMMRAIMVLALTMCVVGCDPPSNDLVLNCQRACAPRPVKVWTWDGYGHNAKCECESANPAPSHS